MSTTPAFHHPPAPHGPELRSGRAEARYRHLATARAPYLDRARECSRLTIPHLIPPDGGVSGTRLPTPYQSVGGSGVSNLASKLLLTMLPPNEPCFRLRVNNLMAEKDQSAQDKEYRTKIDKALSRIEQAVLGDIEAKADRPVVYEGNLHLLVGGNVLYHDDPDHGLRLFPLSRYVMERAPDGTPVEILVEETVPASTLPQDFLTRVREAWERDSGDHAKDHSGPDNTLTVYTHLTRERDAWTVYQECAGQVVPQSRGSYKADACPWLPVRMYHVAGEAYGRSYVETCLGDIKSLEALSKIIVEGGAVSGKVLFFVNPNAVTSARAVAEARNGDVLEGSADEVTTLQVQKGQDFQVVYQTASTITDRLKSGFLMLDGSRRDAERVTAEEIRAVARELEAGLGGVYTVISQEFQLPYIQSRMAHLVRRKELPELPGSLVKPSVVTGFEALGRGNDKAKLIEFLSTARDIMGDVLFQYVNPQDALMRLAASIGIPTDGLLKDEEQQARERQQAEQQQMMQQFGPEALKQFGGMAQAAMRQDDQSVMRQGGQSAAPDQPQP